MGDEGMFYDYECYEDRNHRMGDFIYLDTDKRILEYKAKLSRMAIVDAIESCIANTSIFDYKIEDKKHAELSPVPLKFLPSAGKFKLKENMFKTQNYLVPRSTVLLHFLNYLYENCSGEFCSITRNDLNKIYNTMMLLYDNKNYNDVDVIINLCSMLNVELVSEYDINKESILKAKQIVEDLTFNSETFQTLSNLSLIANSLSTNLDQICKLGLEKKFIEATMIKKQMQKVK